jgi:asparaginyl-tRNA synthetase
MGVIGLTIIGPSPLDYPIQPKEHGIDFLLDHRHFWLRSPRQRAIFAVRNEIEQAIGDFFYERGFLRVDTPILTAAIGERSGLFATEYFEEGNAYLAQTGQLYGEAAAAAFGKIYTFGPTFRAEKSKTRRHLTEFWMIEPEVAWNDSADNMRLQEDFVAYLVQRCLERRAAELKELERDTTALERVKAPFHRVNYTDAVEILRGKGSAIAWGDDLGAEDEALLVADYDRPVFVMNYPKEAKAFYMKENPEDPRTCVMRRLPRARGLRRDHRRVAARGRLRQAPAPHSRRKASRRRLRLVSRSTEVWNVRALGVRPRARTNRRLDLRSAAHP